MINKYVGCMEDLTPRQREILGFIQGHFHQEGYWPSIREIQHNFGFKSTNAVMGHLRALQHKGSIRRVSGQARSFRIVDTHEVIKSEKGALDMPIYGSIVAGYPDCVETAGEIGRLQIDPETAGLSRANQAFALKVRGESMIDAGICDGDVVIVEPGVPQSGDIVAALIDNETTLKRFIREGVHPPLLKAENTAYPTLHPVTTLVIQGIVKALVRRF